ncbi:hybrid sensor histidine kinase/response regulator, partial [Candidatus Aerophobetes bacterium]|nr:hybrid sensor histidine kinase/response regulator [Candidatus Aerophobetes bacterium]
MPQKPTILVIDDEETMRNACQQVLSKSGYHTETCADGADGLRKVRELPPDLVLVDLKMPGISGMEVLEKIGKIDSTIISIVITGYATIESAVEAMKRGAYDFLPKPFTPDELRIIIKRGLERRKLVLESLSLRREKEKIEKNFISMVSHELRRPLIDVQEYLEVVRTGITGRLTQPQKEVLEKASGQINTLLVLIKNWLDMSRIETGRMLENLELLDLSQILHKTVDFLREKTKNKKITLEVNIPAHLPLIKGEKLSIERAFTNLIRNAIDYNREEGKISVKTKEEADYVVIEVSDTGIGIPKKDIPFIFDEFFRVKNRKTRHITGSGLGLSIVKKIVEAHRGSIEVRSEEGKGSTFTVFLPEFT